MSNVRVVLTSKLTDGINIIIDGGQVENYRLFSDSENDSEVENLEPDPTNNNNYSSTLINQVIDSNNVVKQLCNPCIESKYMKIVKYKKITPTTRKLQEIHVDLWESHNLFSLSGKTYIDLYLDKFICKSWIFLLQSKDEFFDAFKLYLPHAEEISKKKLECLQINGRGEFISKAHKGFCNEKSIIIGYTLPYIHEENSITEQYWRTLATIKDSLLINTSLLIKFWAETMDISNYLRNQLPTR